MYLGSESAHYPLKSVGGGEGEEKKAYKKTSILYKTVITKKFCIIHSSSFRNKSLPASKHRSLSVAGIIRKK